MATPRNAHPEWPKFPLRTMSSPPQERLLYSHRCQFGHQMGQAIAIVSNEDWHKFLDGEITSHMAKAMSEIVELESKRVKTMYGYDTKEKKQHGKGRKPKAKTE